MIELFKRFIKSYEQVMPRRSWYKNTKRKYKIVKIYNL